MAVSVNHLSAGLKLEIVSSLAQRSFTRQLRRSSKLRAISKPPVMSYADVRRKPLEFQVGDKVMLKVSPWKGVICFGKRGNLSKVHSTFHVLNLKKCVVDDPLAIPLDEIQIDDKLHFIKEPIEIMDREVKRLKQSRIPIVKVMAISVILVSLDSSEDSVGTPAGRFILLGIIPTTIPDTTPSMTSPTTHIDTTPIPIVSPTIPPSPNYTPALPDYSSASDMKFDPSEDPSSDYIPPLPATLPFLSSTDDSSDNDIPDTPPSPTHGTPFTKTTLSTQRSPIASGGLRRRVMILSPGQPIPHGRPYRYHPNGPVHMMTMRKRVRPLPTHRLAVRHSVDYSSSDHFSLNDSSSSSSSSSSSETSSDSPVDALSDSASSRSSSDHSLPTSPSGTRSSHRLCSLVPSVHRSSTTISERPSHDSSFVSPSRKRSRSPVASIPLSSPILEALSSAHADLLPSPKRIRSPESATDLEGCSKDSFKPYVPRKARLRLRLERGLIEVRVDKVTNPVIGDDTPESAQEGVIKVTYETLGDLVQRFHDHTKEIPVHRVQAIESVQMDQGYRIVATGQMDQVS
ncbi:hypothetical protein Tco_0413858 [Tanacetum coccineum]